MSESSATGPLLFLADRSIYIELICFYINARSEAITGELHGFGKPNSEVIHMQAIFLTSMHKSRTILFEEGVELTTKPFRPIVHLHSSLAGHELSFRPIHRTKFRCIALPNALSGHEEECRDLTVGRKFAAVIIWTSKKSRIMFAWKPIQSPSRRYPQLDIYLETSICEGDGHTVNIFVTYRHPNEYDVHPAL